jgi:hypothetical protein
MLQHIILLFLAIIANTKEIVSEEIPVDLSIFSLIITRFSFKSCRDISYSLNICPNVSQA